MIKDVTKQDLVNMYKQHPATNAFEKRRMQFYFDMYDNPLVDAKYLVYTDGGEYVGECVLVFKDERKHFEFEYEKDILAKSGTCLIKNLYIAENKQGKGYFSKFLDEIKGLAKAKNCIHLTMAVATDNKKAVDIYKHLNAKVFDEKQYQDVGSMLFMQIEVDKEKEKTK